MCVFAAHVPAKHVQIRAPEVHPPLHEAEREAKRADDDAARDEPPRNACTALVERRQLQQTGVVEPRQAAQDAPSPTYADQVALGVQLATMSQLEDVVEDEKCAFAESLTSIHRNHGPEHW